MNPKGAPRKAESLAHACREAMSSTELAANMRKLAETAESEQVRYQALAWLADRAHGKVSSDYSLTLNRGAGDGDYQLADLSDEQLAARLEWLKGRALAEGTPAESDQDPTADD